MLQKLKNTSGETFIEALAAVLIMGLSTVLFIGLITAAKNVNMMQKEADARFYAAMQKVEALEGEKNGDGSWKDTITVNVYYNGSEVPVESMECYVTEEENLRAYQKVAQSE